MKKKFALNDSKSKLIIESVDTGHCYVDYESVPLHTGLLTH